MVSTFIDSPKKCRNLKLDASIFWERLFLSMHGMSVKTQGGNMRSSKGMSRLLAVGGIGVLLSGPALAEDAAAGRWYDALSLNGYVQGSYVANLNKPNNQQNSIRAFDTESNSFNLNAVHLQLSKPMAEDNYAFTTKLHMGRDARIIKSLGTAGATDFDVEEAYLTVATPGLKALTFTAGKFVTSEGFEVIESPLNPNFSEGFLFNFLEPYTHTGIKSNFVIGPMANVTLGIVNGWDNTDESSRPGTGSLSGNEGKTIIWQLATTPLKALTWSFQGTYGPEALADNNSKRLSLDTVAGFTATDRLSFWGQVNWGQDTNVTRTGTGDETDVFVPAALGGESTVRWAGLGLWAQFVVTPWLTEALRFEVVDDQGGANRLGTGVNNTTKEITWTNKFQLTKNTFTRLEFRHDWSNEDVFVKRAGTKDSQNTISADWVVTF
jgi:hypothetical protein